jgi:23S rRNA (cytidine1920-2'-O)/16S rRNA (cytidine1409-2'-O)-methyltransferase
VKKRVDVILCERGLCDSRQRAQALVLAGAVTVDGKIATKAGALVDVDATIDVRAPAADFVSRGAHKLKAALDAFGLSIAGRIALDVGASTGGFTDVLLRRGAKRVYAVDVGYGQLAWRIRQDPRVVVMERTNIRYLDALPEPAELATVDVSFISLGLVLPQLTKLMVPSAEAVALIKPQFEAGRQLVKKGGVVRDPAVHRDVLLRVLAGSQTAGWAPLQLIVSPLLGPAGNREFLAHLGLDRTARTAIDALVAQAIQ